MNDLPGGEDMLAEEISPPALWNLLGVPDEAPPTERIRLLLQQLDDVDYLAPEAWHDALELLNDGTPDHADGKWISRPALGREFEDRLRTEIDQLAMNFWSISPVDRRLQWNVLIERSRGWPALHARLELLKPGLALGHIEPETGSDDRLTSLVQSLARLFPLDAGTRGVLIGEIFGSMNAEPHAWEDAAHRLSRDRPELAQLVPEFLAAVMTLCDRERAERARQEAQARVLAEAAEWEKQNGWQTRDSLRESSGLSNFEAIVVQAPQLKLKQKLRRLSLRYWRDQAQYILFALFFGLPLILMVIAILCEYFLSPTRARRTQGTQRATLAAPADKPANEPDFLKIQDSARKTAREQYRD